MGAVRGHTGISPGAFLPGLGSSCVLQHGSSVASSHRVSPFAPAGSGMLMAAHCLSLGVSPSPGGSLTPLRLLLGKLRRAVGRVLMMTREKEFFEACTGG